MPTEYFFADKVEAQKTADLARAVFKNTPVNRREQHSLLLSRPTTPGVPGIVHVELDDGFCEADSGIDEASLFTYGLTLHFKNDEFGIDGIAVEFRLPHAERSALRETLNAIFLGEHFFNNGIPERPPVILSIDGERRGFTDHDKFYAIGMTIADFRSQFREPDGIEEDGVLYFEQEGLRVGPATDGTIGFFEFFLVPTSFKTESGGSRNLLAAYAVTEKGIERGSSYEEVVKAYGPPTSDKYMRPAGGRYLEYGFGDFTFSNDCGFGRGDSGVSKVIFGNRRSS